jgi:hypothetical protein
MSLTNFIKPGDAQDAALLNANFDDLDTLASDVQAEQIEDYAIDSRHITGTFKTVSVHDTQTANPVVPGGYPLRVCPAGAGAQTTVYDGEPVLIVASCQVVFGAAAGDMTLEVQIDGVAEYSQRWTGGAAANVRFHVMLPYLTVGDASGDLRIELVATAGANWSITDSLIAVLGVQR